jgi:hypothetical protein
MLKIPFFELPGGLFTTALPSLVFSIWIDARRQEKASMILAD